MKDKAIKNWGTAVTLVAMSVLGPAACSSAPASTSEPASSSGPTGQPATAACAESQLRASIDPRHIPGNGTLDANRTTETLPRILVTPPNTRIAVPFTASWPACFSFDVHPVMALPSAP